MVRLFLVALLGINLFAAELSLQEKVRSLLDESTFNTHKKLIDLIFKNEKQFYKNNHIDIIKVTQTLKENGLLKLFFTSPQKIDLEFHTNTNPTLLIKIVSDSLTSLGYFRYFVTESKHAKAGFSWKISLTSEYAVDPTLLRQALQKRGSKIMDIHRKSKRDWIYYLDIKNGYLDVPELFLSQEMRLKRSNNEYWLNIKGGKRVIINSNQSNFWYPYISLYDASLNLLKVYRRDAKTKKLTMHLPDNAMYIKITDLYHPSNINKGLKVKLTGE